MRENEKRVEKLEMGPTLWNVYFRKKIASTAPLLMRSRQVLRALQFRVHERSCREIERGILLVCRGGAHTRVKLITFYWGSPPFPPSLPPSLPYRTPIPVPLENPQPSLLSFCPDFPFRGLQDAAPPQSTSRERRGGRRCRGGVAGGRGWWIDI